MALIPFPRRTPAEPEGGPELAAMLAGFSIEVLPRTLAAIPDLRAHLPGGTRVYLAHIEGTDRADLVAAAARLRQEGFEPMPHVPARLFADRAELEGFVAALRAEADVREALLVAGGRTTPAGPFSDSMALVETGLFEGFRRLHFAGHPESSRDIAPDGSDTALMAALRWKAALAERCDATLGLVTQFAFEAQPVIDWAARLEAAGIGLPVHVGLAGPARLQTLLRYAIACGVGPSLRVLQRRARDLTRLAVPFEPTGIAAAIARHRAAHPGTLLQGLHLFPLGGIAPAADWAARQSRPRHLARAGR